MFRREGEGGVRYTSATGTQDAQRVALYCGVLCEGVKLQVIHLGQHLRNLYLGGGCQLHFSYMSRSGPAPQLAVGGPGRGVTS